VPPPDEHVARIEDIRLDFPSELRIGKKDVVCQFDYFPPALLKAAGSLGIGVELSTYPCSEDDERSALTGV